MFCVKSGAVLQVLCEEWDSYTGSLLRVGLFYRFYVKSGTVLRVLC